MVLSAAILGGRKERIMAKRTKKSQGKKKATEETSLSKAITPEVVEIDDHLVKEAVKHINDVVFRTVDKGVQGMLEIGQYVFEKFFHNDPELVQFRGRQKDSSFRVLGNHAELQMSKSHLHRALHMAIQ